MLEICRPDQAIDPIRWIPSHRCASTDVQRAPPHPQISYTLRFDLLLTPPTTLRECDTRDRPSNLSPHTLNCSTPCGAWASLFIAAAGSYHPYAAHVQPNRPRLCWAHRISCGHPCSPRLDPQEIHGRRFSRSIHGAWLHAISVRSPFQIDLRSLSFLFGCDVESPSLLNLQCTYDTCMSTG